METRTRWSHLSLICKLLHSSPSVVANGLFLSNTNYNGIYKIKRFSYLNEQSDEEAICSLFKLCDLMMKIKTIVVLITLLVIIALVSESNFWHGSFGKRELKEKVKNHFFQDLNSLSYFDTGKLFNFSTLLLMK